MGGGRMVNRFSDRRIRRKKLPVGFWVRRPSILQGFTDFINPADCVFVLYFGSDCGLCLKFSSDPGCKFIAEILADPDLDKAIAGSADFASNLGESADLYTPIYPPPPHSWRF